jgi:glycosyltransferase involved in cell wall biosynthesis
MADNTERHAGHGTSLPELVGRTVHVVARRVPPNIGGEEIQVSLLCAALFQAGATVEVWTTTQGAVLPDGVGVHVRPRSAPMPAYLAWLVIGLGLWRISHLGWPAVVITTRVSGDSAILARLGGLLRLPVVMFLTGGLVGGSEFALQRRPWVKRWIAEGSAAIVAHAASFLDEVVDAGFQGSAVRISTIVDNVQRSTVCTEVLPLAPGSPSLIWCGRDDPVKNLVGLNRLFGGALRSLGTPSLLLISDRAPREQVTGAEVHLRCPSPRVHMAAADALVLTSHFEGQGAVIAEAAVEGTPSVAYGVGGIPETMQRLDGGEVVAVGSPDAAFASAIGRVLERFSDEGERSRLMQRARRMFVEEPPAAWIQLVAELCPPR